MTVYSVSGLLTSALVGAASGLAGQAVAGEAADGLLAAALGIAGLAIAREIRWRRIPLPHLRRQTRDTWAKRRGMTVGSALWGLDLGLIFTTYVAYSGAWVLLLVAMAAGDPILGALIFGSYWIGRALSVWIAPLLVADQPQRLLSLASELGRRDVVFRTLHVMGLTALVGLLSVWLTAGNVQ